MVSVHEIYDNIVNAWRTGEEKTLYEMIVINPDRTVTIMHQIMETTFNPNGSEESLRKFLTMYVRVDTVHYA
tara:strand:- start:555 stop:770 length:216 start_codon:yes stop_codon:yes gene_type:complete